MMMTGGHPFPCQASQAQERAAEAERLRQHEVHATRVFDRGKHMEVSLDGDTPNGWFIPQNPTKMDDLGVPSFQETTI